MLTLTSEINTYVKNALEIKQELQASSSLNAKYQTKTPFIRICSNAIRNLNAAESIEFASAYEKVQTQIFTDIATAFNRVNYNLKINDGAEIFKEAKIFLTSASIVANSISSELTTLIPTNSDQPSNIFSAFDLFKGLSVSYTDIEFVSSSILTPLGLTEVSGGIIGQNYNTEVDRTLKEVFYLNNKAKIKSGTEPSSPDKVYFVKATVTNSSSTTTKSIIFEPTSVNMELKTGIPYPCIFMIPTTILTDITFFNNMQIHNTDSTDKVKLLKFFADKAAGKFLTYYDLSAQRLTNVFNNNLEFNTLKKFLANYDIEYAKLNVIESIQIISGSLYGGGISIFQKDGTITNDNANRAAIGSATPTDAAAQGNNIRSGLGYRPKIGITGISVDTKGKVGALRKATINLRAFTLEQLQLIQTLYMVPGVYLFMEWGWSIYPNNFTENHPVSTENIEKEKININNVTFVPNNIQIDFFSPADDEKIIGQIDAHRKTTHGHYDAMFGVVSNFNWSMNDAGEFDITINLVSQSSSFLSLQMSKNNTGFMNSNFSSNIFVEFRNNFDVTKNNSNYSRLESKAKKLQTDNNNNQIGNYEVPFKKFGVEAAKKSSQAATETPASTKKLLEQFKVEVGKDKRRNLCWVVEFNIEIPVPAVEFKYSNSDMLEDGTSVINSKTQEIFAVSSKKITHKFYFPKIDAFKVEGKYNKFEPILDDYMAEQELTTGRFSDILSSVQGVIGFGSTWRELCTTKLDPVISHSVIECISVYDINKALQYEFIDTDKKSADVRKIFEDRITTVYTTAYAAKSTTFFNTNDSYNDGDFDIVNTYKPNTYFATNSSKYINPKSQFDVNVLEFIQTRAITQNYSWNTYFKYSGEYPVIQRVLPSPGSTTEITKEDIIKKNGGNLPYFISLKYLLILLNEAMLGARTLTGGKKITKESTPNIYKKIAEDITAAYKKEISKVATKPPADYQREELKYRISEAVNEINSYRLFGGIKLGDPVPTRTVDKLTSIDPENIIFITNWFKDKFSIDSYAAYNEWVSTVAVDSACTSEHPYGGNILESCMISAKFIRETIDTSPTLDSFLREIFSKIYSASGNFIDLSSSTSYNKEGAMIGEYIVIGDRRAIDVTGNSYNFNIMNNKSIIKNLTFSGKLPTSFQRVAFIASTPNSAATTGDGIVQQTLQRFSNGYVNNNKRFAYYTGASDTTAEQKEETERQLGKNVSSWNSLKHHPLQPGGATVDNEGFSEVYAKELETKYLISIGATNPSATRFAIAPVGLELSFSIDGTSGLEWGNLLTMNYLPNGLRDAQFQIIGLTDEINEDGWSTKITTILRSIGK